ncbi:MAG: dTMP kinase [Alphaproteobacteria bacterium]|nr:dTMP kinase [Alphaproteobacteria bacterium]
MIVKQNFFITFEGGEGAGKSTQAKLLAEFLEGGGFPCQLTREPGGSAGAEEIRNLVVKGDVARWDVMTEALLMFAARRDHLIKTVWPALKEGKTVICDRFSDSTMAYQGFGYADRGLGQETIEKMYQIVVGDFKPDLTIILDMPVESGVSRALKRDANVNRYEKMGLDFHHNLREAFLKIEKNEPDRCVVINADRSIEEISSDIISVVRARLLKAQS